MGGGGTNIQMPAMPSYGEGLEKALQVQLAMTTGRKVGDYDFSDVLPKGMESIVEAERPGRLAAAQLEADVLRRQIVGGTKVADSQGRVVTGYTIPPAPESGESSSGFSIVPIPSRNGKYLTFNLVNSDGKVVANEISYNSNAPHYGVMERLISKAKQDGILTEQQVANYKFQVVERLARQTRPK